MSQAPRSSYGMRNKAPTAQEKRDRRESGINGLNYKKLQSSVGWSGQVHLSQTAEDAECLLSETQWPKKYGPMYYACVSTGLLFDKQSGRCLQSSKVLLLMETVKPKNGGGTRKVFEKWMATREESPDRQKLRPGPKTKEQKAAIENDETNDDFSPDEGD